MKILLIDDHKLFTEILSDSLMHVLPETNVDTILEFLNLNILDLVARYDLIILDIDLSRIRTPNGLDLAGKILHKQPEKKLCFLTELYLSGYEIEAKKIGAKGFISKEVGINELIDDIRKIIDGKYVFTQSTPLMEEKLTKSEEVILRLYCKGYTRKEMIANLGISMRTLANHLNSIYEKLDVSTYQEMIQKALRLGLIFP